MRRYFNMGIPLLMCLLGYNAVRCVFASWSAFAASTLGSAPKHADFEYPAVAPRVGCKMPGEGVLSRKHSTALPEMRWRKTPLLESSRC
jgi:hypothetical protein